MKDVPQPLNPFCNTSIAQEYEDWYATLGRRADRLEKNIFKWLLGRFSGAHSILEVGCGTGHFTRWFYSQGMSATGVDSSAAMLAETKRETSPAYVLGDAHNLPFAPNSFDLVTFITTIEFLSDPAQALSEATRVARQGIIIGAINRKSWIGQEYLRQGGPIWGHAQLFTLKELSCMVTKIQARVVRRFWKTTLWKLHPWALPLSCGGFIGMGIKIDKK